MHKTFMNMLKDRGYRKYYIWMLEENSNNCKREDLVHKHTEVQMLQKYMYKIGISNTSCCKNKQHQLQNCDKEMVILSTTV